MADTSDPYAVRYVNIIAVAARTLRRLKLDLDYAERYYTDNAKSVIDGLTNGDKVLRGRTDRGIPDPTNTEVKQARTAMNQLLDLFAGTDVTAVANMDQKLSRVDPSARVDD